MATDYTNTDSLSREAIEAEQRKPDVVLGHTSWAVKCDINALSEQIAQCDNAVTLSEVHAELELAAEELSRRLAEIQSRINALYFPSPMLVA